MFTASQRTEPRMKASLTLIVIGSSVLLSSCGAKATHARASIDTAKVIDAIKTDEVHWNSDYKSGDAAAVAAHYAASATVMMPGAAPMVGTAAIKAGLEGALADKGFTLTFASEKVDVAASGDIAASRGAYTETATDPKTKAVVTEKGTFVTVYKPQPDGAWKAIWDINTPGAPAATTAAAQ
jgi:ketosteroid isomerase-like protein